MNDAPRRGVGRPAIVALSPPPSRDSAGRPLGEVAALFEDWLQLRQASNQISSQRIVDGYRDDMARWATLLAGAGDLPAWDRLQLEHLSVKAIQGALGEMARAGLAVAARKRALSPLRGLCRWLTRTGRLSVDPTADEDLTIRSSPARLPVAFSDAEMARITEAVITGSGNQRDALRWPARDLAALALLAGCGLDGRRVVLSADLPVGCVRPAESAC
jgi:site-specific recombinase XerC